MSFVRWPIRATRRSNEPKVDSFDFAGGVQCLGQATLEGGELLRRVLGRQRIELGMCQSDNDLAVRGERPSQRPDRAAELDQPGQFAGDVLRCAGHDPRVQLLQFALDSLEGAEVAGDDPLENRCDERRCVERTDLASALGALAKLLEHLDLPMMSGDDPVPAERAFEGSEDGLTLLDAGRVQRHVHTLARVRQRRAAGLLEQPLRVLVAELERLLQSRHLLLGRVSQGEPEQLVVGEPFECGPPVLDLLGLSLVEQEDREHLPLFPEAAAFPCPRRRASKSKGPCSKPRVAHGPLVSTHLRHLS